MFRDFCAVAGLSAFWEASGGSAVADAAAAHVAISAPVGAPHKYWSCQEYNAEPLCTGGPIIENGYMSVGDEPGLGVTPNPEVVRDPLARITCTAKVPCSPSRSLAETSNAPVSPTTSSDHAFFRDIGQGGVSAWKATPDWSPAPPRRQASR